MTTTSSLLLCVLLGQVGDSHFAPNIPVPQSSARRTIETPAAMPPSRFGAPTPAEPSVTDASALAQPRSVLTTPPQASDLTVSAGNENAIQNAATKGDVSSQFNPAANFHQPAAHNDIQPVAALTEAPIDDENSAAKQLIEQAFPSATDAGSERSQIALQDVVAVTSDRTRRMAAIRTYWEASTLMADWQFSAEEHDLIRQISAPAEVAQRAVLSAAQSAAYARLIEAKMAASSAQFALSEFVPSVNRDLNSQPPLPIDAPLAGKYNTQFETIFAAQVAPAGLRRIHETLPLRKDLVEARAQAVFAAGDAVEQQLAAYRSGRASLDELLKELENLRRQRGAFLGALRDYNLDIAEYAMGIARPNDPPERVVGMMIKVPQRATNVAAAGGRSVLVQPAGTTAPTVIIHQTPPLTAPTNNVIVMPPRIADQSSGTATALPRPTTERVLGQLRDVTNNASPQVLQPTSNFEAQGNTSAADDVRTPTSQFGGSQFGGSQFGASQFGASQGAPAQINGTTIVSPAENAPALPPLTP